MSLGVLLSQDWGRRPIQELLQEVDNALYAAKGAGRNCVKVAMPKGLPEYGNTPVRESARTNR